MTDAETDFPTWLRSERGRLRLTQSDLSAISGVSIPTISNIERGATPAPADRTKNALIEALENHNVATPPHLQLVVTALQSAVFVIEDLVKQVGEHTREIAALNAKIEEIRRSTDLPISQQSSVRPATETALLRLQETFERLVRLPDEAESTDP